MCISLSGLSPLATSSHVPRFWQLKLSPSWTKLSSVENHCYIVYRSSVWRSWLKVGVGWILWRQKTKRQQTTLADSQGEGTARKDGLCIAQRFIAWLPKMILSREEGNVRTRERVISDDIEGTQNRDMFCLHLLLSPSLEKGGLSRNLSPNVLKYLFPQKQK